MTDNVTAYGMDSVAIGVFVETFILLRKTPDEGVFL
jgi:hypothetical protein